MRHRNVTCPSKAKKEVCYCPFLSGLRDGEVSPRAWGRSDVLRCGQSKTESSIAYTSSWIYGTLRFTVHTLASQSSPLSSLASLSGTDQNQLCWEGTVEAHPNLPAERSGELRTSTWGSLKGFHRSRLAGEGWDGGGHHVLRGRQQIRIIN